MKFTDIFIKRPVLSMVVSLLILLVGAMAISKMQLRQYPETEISTVTVTTTYTGASAQLMQGFVTTTLQSAIAGVEGIDYMTSASTLGTSTISIFLKTNYDASTAENDINNAIQAVSYKLPTGVNNPVVTKQDRGSGLLYIAFKSDRLSSEQISDFIERIVKPKLQSVAGVATVDILGEREFAMRIWLNPEKMAALNVTPSDVKTALQNSNVQATAGSIKGKYDTINILAATDLHSADDFGNIVITNDNGSLVKLKDVAKVDLGAESYDSAVWNDGNPAIVLQISNSSSANPLTVAQSVQDALPEIEDIMPPGMSSTVVYNAGEFIQESISGVESALIEAVLIVLGVIFLFLGSIRAVGIPLVTIPVSLIGACSIMLALGFSINVLTLLAMVLAIGLVVDDAIVVLENVNRHLEMGKTPFQAALDGAREIGTAVISMTLTLAAVYAPIGFVEGITGTLFIEFAFTLAGAVIISGIVALTLTPMMCSKMMSTKQLEGAFFQRVEGFFERLKHRYTRALTSVLNYRGAVVMVTIIVLISCFVFYSTSQSELAPNEDQSAVFAVSNARSDANIDFTTKYMTQVSNLLQKLPEKQTDILISGKGGTNNGMSIVKLVPPQDRKLSQAGVVNALNAPLAQITGLKTFALSLPTLPGTSLGQPIQVVLLTTGSYDQLTQTMQKLIEKANASGMFVLSSTDLKIDSPQLNINVDTNLAGDMGVTSEEIASALGINVSSGYITRFSLDGRSFDVIPQVPQKFRDDPNQLNKMYVKTSNGDMVPLSSFVSLSTTVEPGSLNQFQQLNSATFNAVLMPGRTIGDGLALVTSIADQIMPEGMHYDFEGQSRQFVEEGSSLEFALFAALIIIFLVLAAQFESFRDPLIVLVSVPLCLGGALLLINIGLGSINIFTQIALITLIGLISKHGILIVEFANQIRDEEGLDVHDAVIKAASLRLRPILMTTAAMVFGSVPLLFSSEGLVHSQHQLAMVIISGMLLGTCFTIFVVPTFYTLFAHKDRSAMTKDLVS